MEYAFFHSFIGGQSCKSQNPHLMMSALGSQLPQPVLHLRHHPVEVPVIAVVIAGNRNSQFLQG